MAAMTTRTAALGLLLLLLPAALVGRLGLARAAPAADRHADSACAAAAEQGTADRFMRHEAAARAAAPAVASLAAKAADEDHRWERWDGQRATAVEHAAWMLRHVREHCDPAAPGFRLAGTRANVTYEEHSALTAAASGSGYFRLSAVIAIPPELAVALLLHAAYLGEMDETVMAMDFVKRFADGRTVLAVWAAEAGFPFRWRDGLDVSSWHRDDDGVFWQVAVSVPNEMAEFANGAVRAVNRYWGYRLAPVLDGTSTQLTLVTQTELNGWMPKFLVNYFVGGVLADYVRELERTGQRLQASGDDQSLIRDIIPA